MALPPLLIATLQSAFMAGLSNVMAQLIQAYQNGTEMWFDWIPVFQLVMFGFLTTPPNILWQQYLESTFPAHPSPTAPSTTQAKSSKNAASNADSKATSKAAANEKTKEKTHPAEEAPLSIRNTLAKLLLDQTLGAAVNTLLFLVYAYAMRAATAHLPRETSFAKAIGRWSTPGAVNFDAVDLGAVLAQARADFWPIMKAGWRLWPAVAGVNYTLIKTVEGRTLVGASAGLVWGVYISLVSS